MNIFDIIGPVMIGPSSSHTAGAARIGLFARKLLGEKAARAKITLYGSFAQTYKGHGTDRAIIGGLLGYGIDDPRLRYSYDLALKENLQYEFIIKEYAKGHPNSVKLEICSFNGRSLDIEGVSVGGGNIKINRIDNLEVEITGKYYTIVIEYMDKPGMVGSVTSLLGKNNVNIAEMRVYRASKGGKAIMVIETDDRADEELRIEMSGLKDILSVTGIEAMD